MTRRRLAQRVACACLAASSVVSIGRPAGAAEARLAQAECKGGADGAYLQPGGYLSVRRISETTALLRPDLGDRRTRGVASTPYPNGEQWGRLRLHDHINVNYRLRETMHFSSWNGYWNDPAPYRLAMWSVTNDYGKYWGLQWQNRCK